VVYNSTIYSYTVVLVNLWCIVRECDIHVHEGDPLGEPPKRHILSVS